MTLTDKTGHPVTVTQEDGRFTVAVDGKTVGLTAFAARDGQRVFFHTEVDDAFGGRGLATIVIAEALAATRDEGLRIVHQGLSSSDRIIVSGIQRARPGITVDAEERAPEEPHVEPTSQMKEKLVREDPAP